MRHVTYIFFILVYSTCLYGMENDHHYDSPFLARERGILLYRLYKSGDLSLKQQLLNECTAGKGFDPTVQDRRGQSLVLAAVTLKDIPWVRLLCERGADPFAPSHSGTHAVERAIFDEQLDVLDIFYSNIPHFITRSDHNQITALGLAAMHGAEKSFEFLVQRTPDLDAAAHKGLPIQEFLRRYRTNLLQESYHVPREQAAGMVNLYIKIIHICSALTQETTKRLHQLITPSSDRSFASPVEDIFERRSSASVIVSDASSPDNEAAQPEMYTDSASTIPRAISPTSSSSETLEEQYTYIIQHPDIAERTREMVRRMIEAGWRQALVVPATELCMVKALEPPIAHGLACSPTDMIMRQPFGSALPCGDCDDLLWRACDTQDILGILDALERGANPCMRILIGKKDVPLFVYIECRCLRETSHIYFFVLRDLLHQAARCGGGPRTGFKGRMLARGVLGLGGQTT